MGIFKNREESRKALEKEKIKNDELQIEITKQENKRLSEELDKLRSEIMTESLEIKKDNSEKELTKEELKEIFNEKVKG